MRSGVVTKRNEVLQSMFPDRDVSEIEGEFIPDIQEPEQEYRDEFRFFNLPISKLRRLLANASEDDRSAISLAIQSKHTGFAVMESGEPYRGEEREVTVAKSMRELAEKVKPISYVTAKSLSAKGIMPLEPQWVGIFDFEELSAGLSEIPKT